MHVHVHDCVVSGEELYGLYVFRPILEGLDLVGAAWCAAAFAWRSRLHLYLCRHHRRMSEFMHEIKRIVVPAATPPHTGTNNTSRQAQSLTWADSASGSTDKPSGSGGTQPSLAHAVSRRLTRQMSRRSLVKESADHAHEILEKFAALPKPEWSQYNAAFYGALIDVLIVTRLPVADDFIRCIVNCGGPEQMRFMLALAQFDRDGNGSIDDDELVEYEKLADSIINDAVTMCANLALVSSLLIGLTHLITVGRPTPFILSDESSEVFGPWLYAGGGDSNPSPLNPA